MKFEIIDISNFDNLKPLFPSSNELWIKYRENRLKQLDNKEIVIFVVKEEDEIIGEITANYISHSLIEETIKDKRIYFEAFRIVHKFRGKGYGQSLFNYAIGYFKERNYTEFTIGVEEDNIIAKHIYTKLGFITKIAEGIGDEFDPSDYSLYLKESKNVKEFIKELEKYNMKVEYYETNGSDINGACGQMISD